MELSCSKMVKERHRMYLWLGENGEKIYRKRRKEWKEENNGVGYVENVHW